MTIAEMHLAFELAVQEVDSSARDDFLDNEIDSYLNQAQLYFVKDRFSGGNEPGHMQSPSRIGDLEPLVNTAPLVPSVAAEGIVLGSQYEWLIPYPADYMFPQRLEAGITRSANPAIVSKEYTECKPINDAQVKFYRVTAMNTPYIRIPGFIFKANFMHVFCDSETTLIDGRFTYVRLPDTLLLDTTTPANSVDSELPEHTHDDIVNIAATIAMGDLRQDPSPRISLETEAQ